MDIWLSYATHVYAWEKKGIFGVVDNAGNFKSKRWVGEMEETLGVSGRGWMYRGRMVCTTIQLMDG